MIPLHVMNKHNPKGGFIVFHQDFVFCVNKLFIIDFNQSLSGQEYLGRFKFFLEQFFQAAEGIAAIFSYMVSLSQLRLTLLSEPTSNFILHIQDTQFCENTHYLISYYFFQA